MVCLALTSLRAQPAPETAPAVEPDFTDRVGVMTHFAQNWGLGVLARVSEAGVRHVRDELYWESVEPEPGRFVFPPRYDAYMGALRQRDIRPLIALTFGNPHYDGGLTPHTEAGFEAYARYCVAVLRHYGDQLRAVEIWNEYNGSFAKGPATEDRPGTYLKMLRAAYTAIKRERPDVIVLGGATSGLPMPFFERLFAEGGLQFMDAVSIHPYQTRETPEGLDKRIDSLQELIARHNGDREKPVWVTEIGWPTHVSQAPGDLAISEHDQAAFLVRAYALLLSTGVERVYWYLLRDYNQFATMGLVRQNPDFSPKPAHTALQTLVDQLEGVRAMEREPAPDGVFSVRFDRASGPSTRLLWALRPFTLSTPGATRLLSLHGVESPPPETIILGETPVYIDGEVRPPPPPVSPPSQALLAEAASGFSLEQGESGWSYGCFLGDQTDFIPITRSHTTDWKEEWLGPYRNLAISAGEQHPASNAGVPVAAVRRWTSEEGGSLRISGRFKSNTRGDGVRVRVLSDGQVRLSERIGGGEGRPIVADFDLVCPVAAGGHVDFAVDPGPAGDPDYDVTQVTISIHALERVDGGVTSDM